MDLLAYIVDWKKARALKDAGTFDEEMSDACSRKRLPAWIQSCEDFTHLDAAYFIAVDAFRLLRTGLPPGASPPADEFFQGVIAEHGVCQDFGDEPLFRCDVEPGRFFHSISPESAAKLAALGHQLDWVALKDAFRRKVKVRELKRLVESSWYEGPKETFFDEWFQPYVERWIGILDQACAKKRGIITELQ